ncbi:zinc ABC transporter substrate-binding protein [Deferribacterales bacterium Es71-Z0220]|uniref:metal ABC transporter solute-binding protein, Zn/Mn family n=1 Tax=Deferrivibrio essentukiensis TaxID=2880922 RepID=UPI001F61B88A|nr:zinc ABC transporter substrate-binding protein [Deferrivibrio essentukiensis]MCB4204981.1 zinc ABC transporter substrate-binding protein [Deferrivibrio essentukiensis]
MKKWFLCVIILLFSHLSYSADIIFVSISPVKYIADNIVGGKYQVKALVPENFNPHLFEPRPKEMRELSKAKYYFSIGDTFDHVWLEKLYSVNKGVKVVYIDKDITKQRLEKHSHDEKHENEGDNNFYDPHIWLSPNNVKIMAKNILDFMAEADKDNLPLYESNYQKLVKSMDELVINFKKTFDRCESKNILVFHPSWGYFAKDFGLKQVAIEAEGIEPSMSHIREIVDFARKEDVKFLFVQPQIDSRITNTLAKQLNIEIIKVNPLSYNYIGELELIKNAFEKKCKGENE